MRGVSLSQPEVFGLCVIDSIVEELQRQFCRDAYHNLYGAYQGVLEERHFSEDRLGYSVFRRHQVMPSKSQFYFKFSQVFEIIGESSMWILGKFLNS